MKKYRQILSMLLLSAATFMGGCSQDYFENNDRVKGDEVLVRTIVSSGSRAEVQEDGIENSIKKVRVMIFIAEKSVAAGLPPGYVIVNKVYTDMSNIPVHKVSPGHRDFFVIANETSQMSDKLNAVTTVEQLKKIKLDYDVKMYDGKTQFVMSQSLIDQNLAGGQSIELNFALVRVASKVRFALTFDALTATEGGGLRGRSLKVDSIRILRITDSVNVVAQAPRYTWAKVSMSRLIEADTPDDQKAWKLTDSLYIAERIFENADLSADTTRATFMMIYAQADGTPCRYRVNIGDVASKGVLKPDYTVTRNTQYNVVGEFTKLGETDGLDIKVTISPWNNLSWTEDIGVTPVITKNISDFTPCSGEAQFTVAMNETAQWRVQIDNSQDFAVYGTKQNTGTGDNGGVFNVVPRRLHVSTSTNVSIVVNGNVVDQTVISVKPTQNKFEYEAKVVQGKLFVMDRNLGASTPKDQGCLYKFGSKVGLHAKQPSKGVQIGVNNPLPTAVIDRMTLEYTTNAVTSYDDVTYQNTPTLLAANDPCPVGWRVPNVADYATLNAGLTATTQKNYGVGTSEFGRLISISPDYLYIPISLSRGNSTTDGSLGPIKNVTTLDNTIYLVRDKAYIRRLGLEDTFNDAVNSAAHQAAMIRCVADVGGYMLEYPNSNDATVTVQRRKDVIETPLNQTTDLVHYISVAETGQWTLMGFEGHESWLKIEKVRGKAGTGSGISGLGHGLLKVTVSPNDQVPLIGVFRPARQISLKLNNYVIMVYQGGYVKINGRLWLDRNLMNGKNKKDAFDRVYPAAIPIGFPENFVAATCSHAALGQTLVGFFNAGETISGDIVGQGDNLDDWAGEDKSKYDPCPTGWKVGRSADYQSLDMKSWSNYGSGQLGQPYVQNTSSGRYKVVDNVNVFLPSCGAYYNYSFGWTIQSGACYMQADKSGSKSQYFRTLTVTGDWITDMISSEIMGAVRCVEAPEDI